MGGDHLSNTVFGGDGLPTYRPVESYTYWFRPDATLTLAATAAADVLVLLVVYALYRFRTRHARSLRTSAGNERERLRLEGTRAQCLSDSAAVNLIGWTCRALSTVCFMVAVFQLQLSMLHHQWGSVRLDPSRGATDLPPVVPTIAGLFAALLLALIAGAHIFALRARRQLPAAPPRPPVRLRLRSELPSASMTESAVHETLYQIVQILQPEGQMVRLRLYAP